MSNKEFSYTSFGSLVVRLWNSGDKDSAASIMARFVSPDEVTASKNGKHKVGSDEGPLLDFVQQYLDSLGFDELLKVSKKKASELEKMKPSLHLYTGRKVGHMTPK